MQTVLKESKRGGAVSSKIAIIGYGRCSHFFNQGLLKYADVLDPSLVRIYDKQATNIYQGNPYLYPSLCRDAMETKYI